MTTASDMVWEVLDKLDLLDPQDRDRAIEFADYVCDHLRNSERMYVDPEEPISTGQLDKVRAEVMHWLRRMLNHKRSDTAHWPDKALEDFCDQLAPILTESNAA